MFESSLEALRVLKNQSLAITIAVIAVVMHEYIDCLRLYEASLEKAHYYVGREIPDEDYYGSAFQAACSGNPLHDGPAEFPAVPSVPQDYASVSSDNGAHRDQRSVYYEVPNIAMSGSMVYQEESWTPVAQEVHGYNAAPAEDC